MPVDQQNINANINQNGALVPLGYQQLTPVAATNLTPPAGATIALIQAIGANASWRDDGTAPTVLVGMQIIENDTIQYNGSLAAFSVISTATVNVTFYKYG